jgi:hypothetical protein
MSKFGAGVYILVENGYFFPKKERDFRATLPTTK